jgi:type I restriction enzyme, S subunit
LNDVSSITRLAGYEYSTVWKVLDDGEIIALRGFNIGENTIIEKDFERISSQLSNQLNRSKLYYGDIVFPCVGTIGNAVVIRENGKYHINQNIAKITPKKFMSSDFIVYYLMSEECKKEIDKFNATSSQPNVLVGSLRKFIITYPKDINEQKRIVSAILSIKETIDIDTVLFSSLKALKTGLMQDLLSGRIRVNLSN